jgi:uncharacterized repeat protein (TIGR01451 family)
LLRVKSAAFLTIALLASLVSVAQAKPVVALKLSAQMIQHQANGAEHFVPIDTAALKPGDEIRYVIVATNTGTNAAKNLVPVGRIPAGTAYVAGSASSPTANPEFSLDGGKTWAAMPTVKVHTRSGDVVQKADPATYTTIRWHESAALEPKASQTFVYAVTIK